MAARQKRGGNSLPRSSPASLITIYLDENRISTESQIAGTFFAFFKKQMRILKEIWLSQRRWIEDSTKNGLRAKRRQSVELIILLLFQLEPIM